MSNSTTQSADELATHLFSRRDELLRALPYRIRPARNLDDEQREMIVDDAVTYVALEHRKPIANTAEAEEVFFQRAYHLAMRAVDKRRRHSLIRGRFERASFSAALEDVAATDAEDPAALAEAAVETAVIREFIASLTDLERQVWRVKWDGETSSRHPGQGVGYVRIADELGVAGARVRKAERSITAKLDRFTVLLVAGRLCSERATALNALAAGVADATQSNLAHAHLEQCGACRAGFNAQLRAMHSAAYKSKVAALIPPAPVADDRVRSQLAEWISGLVSQNPDAAGTTAQAAASGLGRGAGGVLAAKLIAGLAAGAATIGATAGLLSENSRPDADRAVKPTQSAAPAPSQTPAPVATPNFAPAVRAGSKAAAAVQRRRTRLQRRAARISANPTDQEQTITSPAPAGSRPNGQSEFDVGSGANLPEAAPAPPNTAPGASEFGP